jgi:hypothetical protein
MHQREPIAVGEVSPHLAIQLVVVEQAIQLDEHRVRLVGQFGHAREDLFGLVAVDEQGEAPISPTALSRSRAFSPVPCTSIRSNPGLPPSKAHR